MEDRVDRDEQAPQSSPTPGVEKFLGDSPPESPEPTVDEGAERPATPRSDPRESFDPAGQEQTRSHQDLEETDDDLAAEPAYADGPIAPPQLAGHTKGRRLVRKEDQKSQSFRAEQRLLLLDIWRRSGLPAGDFATLVGLSKHTIYGWHRRFLAEGPAGLVEQPRGGPKGSRLPDLTQRTILMLKESHPDWGCQRISDMLLRGPALPASPSAVARVLHEAGYELEEAPTRPHPPAVRHFERAKPNELWQTDLFSFVLKRQNRRVYLVAFMDDHSRFITSYGLHSTQSAPLVIEVLRAGIASYGVPGEILSDNGSQYITWRGKSAFAKELEKRGIRHVVARPRRPQTLGKIERFWGTLWRELIESAIFVDLEEARRRIGWFIDYYNFQRVHRGVDGLVPADRFFGAAPEVLRTLQARVAANALELARQGVPKRPFYLTGQMAGKSFSIHAAGERVILTDARGMQQEITLELPGQPPGACDTASSKQAGQPNPGEPLETATSAPSECDATDLPRALCPDGSPPEGLTDSSQPEPPSPGVSPLDQDLPILDELADGRTPRVEPPQQGGDQ